MSKVSLLVLRSSNCSQAQDSCSKDTASLGGTTYVYLVLDHGPDSGSYVGLSIQQGSS